MENRDEILTAKEVAGILKCSPSFVYRLRDAGTLAPRYKFGEGQKGWRWSGADVARFIVAHDVSGRAEEPAIPRFVPLKLTKAS